MTDITTIPVDELVKDLKDSIEDIRVCAFSLGQGINQYSGGAVQERLTANQGFTDVIIAELVRRGEK